MTIDPKTPPRWHTGRILAITAAVALALPLASAAYAAPGSKLQQYKVPTAGSSPKDITQASDGNLWFTESFVYDQNVATHNVGRITQSGDVTEFAVCDSCFPSDIVQGSDGLLYYTRNDAPFGRVTTSGEALPVDPEDVFRFNGNGLDEHGDDIWIADFNNHSVWRYDIPSDTFTSFDATTAESPDATPLHVAVGRAGIVWFTDANGFIGRLDPATGAVTTTVVDGFPRQIDIAADGSVWFTERFSQAVGRLDPVTDAVTLFPLNGGPEGIAPAADGSMWVTRTTAGNIVRITPTGAVLDQTRTLKGSEPFGITVAANGDPWFAMLRADKIGRLNLP